MTNVEARINKLTSLEFKRTDMPFDYRKGLCDPNFDPCAFSCEIERLYSYKAEDVFEILKSCILGDDEDDRFPMAYSVDIMEAIIKLDDFINLRKRIMQK